MFTLCRLFILAVITVLVNFNGYASAQVRRCADRNDDLIYVLPATDSQWDQVGIAPRMVRIKQWGSEIVGFEGESLWAPLSIDHTVIQVVTVSHQGPDPPYLPAEVSLVDTWTLTIGDNPVLVLPGPGLVTVDVWLPYGADGSTWYQVMGFRHEPHSGISLKWCWAGVPMAIAAGRRRSRR